jgi:hypothetical protein
MRWLPPIIALCSAPAIAQNSGTRTDLSEKQVERVVEEIGPTFIDSPFSLASAIEVNASEDGTTAAIRVSSVVSRSGSDFHTLSLAASAPVDKAERSAFSALDPFANGVSLEGRYTFSRLLGRRNPRGTANDLCEDVVRRTGVALPPSGCGEEYILANAPDRIDELRDLHFRNATVAFVGVTGRVGRERFEFLDATMGTPAQETRAPWSVGGFVGLSYLPWRNSFAVDFRHQTRFKAAATAAVCPSPATGVTVCPVGPVGPPTEREQNIFGAEYRQRVGNGFAFSIRGSYDMTGDIFQLDMPVYLISDNSSGLNAGVRARYVNDPDADDLNEGWLFGIFVSRSFGLFQ